MRVLIRQCVRAWRNERICCYGIRDSSTNRSLKICIIGSGPAGFYTTKYLLKALPNVRIDMMEALPMPYGLVRYGVAPDHPEVKAVTHDFSTVASDERFEYFGNVKLGYDIHIHELQSMYHAIVLAYGAGDDRLLHVPGEFELNNVLGARSFVGWYNGHPDFADMEINLDADAAVIVGQGNVAIDCARILLKPTNDLATTDISTGAMCKLSKSRVKKVYIVGRRGAAQAAFTIKELRELSKLEGVGCVLHPSEFEQSLNAISEQEVSHQRAKKRIIDLLSKIAFNYEKAVHMERQVHLKFLMTPVKLSEDSQHKRRIGSVLFEKNHLIGDACAQKAIGRGIFESLGCGLLIRSIGYLPVPINEVPFDTKKNTISNKNGRIVDFTTLKHLPGLYCCGWVKRGPVGIIGTNVVDARETAAAVVEDVTYGNIQAHQIRQNAVSLLSMISSRNPYTKIVNWKDVKKIERAEKHKGEMEGRLYAKLTSVEEMLSVLK